MSGVVDPDEALDLWADHPRYAQMKQMLHPSLADAALWIIKPDDDATVVMAALVAMQRCSDLVIDQVTSLDHLRNVLARCYAVAEACGRVTSTYTTGAQTIVRFEKQSVSA